MPQKCPLIRCPLTGPQQPTADRGGGQAGGGCSRRGERGWEAGGGCGEPGRRGEPGGDAGRCHEPDRPGGADQQHGGGDQLPPGAGAARQPAAAPASQQHLPPPGARGWGQLKGGQQMGRVDQLVDRGGRVCARTVPPYQAAEVTAAVSRHGRAFKWSRSFSSARTFAPPPGTQTQHTSSRKTPRRSMSIRGSRGEHLAE